ncbi:hypothetical protein CALCODRAFT_501256 [Calocera cornea HHB12733]|uniref:Uncharacterized protein n=1 Tax=Calocera cornea HHB12733 TaxID=1353952 RepID=A0A165DQG0_9BASI|nr:hypothetical protein CALCODRAFT_501256 [Calocera cornea HHB12733]
MSLTNWNTSVANVASTEAASGTGLQDDPVNSALASPEAQFLADLLRSIQSNRDAQEAERKRRSEWEANVEARYKARIAEMDIRFTSMQQQIDALKRMVTGKEANNVPGPSTVSTTSSPAVPGSQTVTPARPSVPVSTATVPRPIQPLPQGSVYPPALFPAPPPDMRSSLLGKRTRDPGPAPDRILLASMDPVTAGLTEFHIEQWRKLNGRRKKDSRPTTIQTATRVHLLRVMGIASDKVLPASHVEDEPYVPGMPIKWVWDKTPKQSPHNGRMKALFIADLQASRSLYPLVAEQDFAYAVVDRAFDQAFVTFRQKARAQAGLAPETEEQRLEKKSKRARRANRKKAKLAHRVAARALVPTLQDKAFDGALELAMMSSESSDSYPEDDVDDNEDGDASPQKSFRVRGLPWRSQRLKNLYATLDLADEKEQKNKPKRGVGRKERRAGPDKEGEEALPPKAVPGWMVSKKFKDAEHEEVVAEVVDLPEVDWSKAPELGDESDVEDNDEL